MNPMTNVKNIKKLSEQELRRSLKTSWHDQYKDSAWIFIGGLPFDLTEGDVICVFSQFGEVVNINLVREKATGKSKGFCFLCYEDQRSTVLAVDNFNGMKLLGRTLRVDHVQNYKAPKDSEKKHAETRHLMEEGCAPTVTVPCVDIKKEKFEDKEDCLILERVPSIVDLANDRSEKQIKSEPKDRKKKKKREKKSSRDKEKKDRESDKKKKKKTKRKSSSPSSSNNSSSSSSDSSSESSSEESDSSEEKVRNKKHKHKVGKKKKSKRQEEESRDSEMSASSKRRKIEEKIKVLEKALNNVRSGRNKQE